MSHVAPLGSCIGVSRGWSRDAPDGLQPQVCQPPRFTTNIAKTLDNRNTDIRLSLRRAVSTAQIQHPRPSVHPAPSACCHTRGSGSRRFRPKSQPFCAPPHHPPSNPLQRSRARAHNGTAPLASSGPRRCRCFGAGSAGGCRDWCGGAGWVDGLLNARFTTAGTVDEGDGRASWVLCSLVLLAPQARFCRPCLRTCTAR